MRKDVRRDLRTAAQFDGGAYVSLTLWHAGRRRCHRATEIAHELGYRLTKVSFTRSATFLDLRRDDSEQARTRASDTAAVLQATGRLPGRIPVAPSDITSLQAAKARFQVACHHTPEARLFRLGTSAWAALMLVLIGALALARYPGAGLTMLTTGVLCLLGVTAAVVSSPWRTRRHHRNLELIRRYDRERDSQRA